mmetsp:Transcript_127747/g.409003  ORF Transcript_127747/g.409003 Transcript_127747/m.409003 type:complete len:296 (-) Transcript_127747:709-1596(-)
MKDAKNDGPSMAITLLLICVWHATSLVAITTSKMTMQMLKVPLVLCCAQFLIATAVSGSALLLQRKALSLGRAGLSVLASVAITYTLGFVFTNLAFSLTHASFVETVKAGEPISTVVLALLLLGERERVATYASLLPVVLGVGMASSGEAGGGFDAFAATAASNFCFSARAVFAKQLKRDFPTSPAATSDVSLFFHISWMGLLGLVPLAFCTEAFALRSSLASPSFESGRFLGVMALNGLMYTGYNQFRPSKPKLALAVETLEVDVEVRTDCRVEHGLLNSDLAATWPRSSSAVG